MGNLFKSKSEFETNKDGNEHSVNKATSEELELSDEDVKRMRLTSTSSLSPWHALLSRQITFSPPQVTFSPSQISFSPSQISFSPQILKFSSPTITGESDNQADFVIVEEIDSQIVNEKEGIEMIQNLIQ